MGVGGTPGRLRLPVMAPCLSMWLVRHATPVAWQRRLTIVTVTANEAAPAGDVCSTRSNFEAAERAGLGRSKIQQLRNERRVSATRVVRDQWHGKCRIEAGHRAPAPCSWQRSRKSKSIANAACADDDSTRPCSARFCVLFLRWAPRASDGGCRSRSQSGRALS